MTNKLEKQFFETFGIEPREEKYCLWECKEPSLEHVPCNKECEYQRHNIYYPEITDRRLLELICIANEQDTYPSTTNMNNIKARTLKMLLGALQFSLIYTESPNRRRLFIKRVRTLFEEG